MRKLSLIFTIFFSMNIIALAMLPPSTPPVERTYTEMFDSVFSVISKSQATTGILYDRVVPFANFQ